MSFFDSVRERPWRRTEDRMIGGVCAGIAHRFGISPVLVRLLFCLGALVGGLPLIIYGFAWLLLPEHRDGRIHLDELIHGRPDVAAAGALAFIVIGALGPLLWFADTRDTVAVLLGGIAPALVFGLIIAVPIVAGYASRQRTPRAGTDSNGLVHSTPSPSPASELLRTGVAAPPVPAQAEATHVSPLEERPPARTPRPRKPRTPAVPARFTLGIVALAISLGALTLLLMPATLAAWLTAGGVFLAVTAIGLIIAASRGRRGSWLTAISWLGALPVAAATALAFVLPNAVLFEPGAAPVRFGATASQHSSALVAGNIDLPTDQGDVTAAAGFGNYRLRDLGDTNAIVTVTSTGSSSISLWTYGGWEVQTPTRTYTTPLATIKTEGDQTWASPDYEDLYLSPGQQVILKTPAAVANPSDATRIELTLGFAHVAASTDVSDGVDYVKRHSEPTASPSPTTTEEN